MHSSRRVAAVIMTFSEVGRSILRGVASYAERARNWELYTATIGIIEPNVLRLALHADGLITWLINDDVAASVREARLPIVGVHYRGDLPIASVRNNNRRIAELAAEHFVNQGFRQFGFFGAQGKAFSSERSDCFSQVLAERGYPCHSYHSPRVDAPTLGWHNADEQLIGWLRELPKPIGILAANDGMGLQLITNAKHANIRVPDDVAVVGVDNDEMLCCLTSPQMSSIDPDGEALGFQAAALLDRQLNGEVIGKQTVYIEPRQLVVRHSSNVVAVNDPDIASAVRFIRENIPRGLSVDDVVHEVAVPRRTLEREFRNVLGRSIHEEITESRIRLARQLLIDTDIGISEISTACGFRYRTHLNAVFRKRVGQSPAAFRKIFEGRKDLDPARQPERNHAF